MFIVNKRKIAIAVWRLGSVGSLSRSRIEFIDAFWVPCLALHFLQLLLAALLLLHLLHVAM